MTSKHKCPGCHRDYENPIRLGCPWCGWMPYEKGAKSLPTATCNRCGHTWTLRVPNPQSCPNCHSPYWNKERVYPRKEKS
jgi:hypothetical protein